MSSSLSLESVCSARCFSPSSSAIGAVPGVRRKLCVSVREKPEQPVGAVFVGCSTKHRKSRNHEMWSSSRDCITSAHSAGLDFASSKEGNACATTSSKSGARFLHDEGMGTIDRAEAVRAQLFPRLNKLSPVKSLRRRCVSPSTRVVTSVLVPPREQYADETDYMKAGGEFIDLVQLQARKPLQQTKIGEKVTLSCEMHPTMYFWLLSDNVLMVLSFDKSLTGRHLPSLHVKRQVFHSFRSF